jgi:PleD family two-component response regulator
MAVATDIPAGAVVLIVDDDHHDVFMLQRRLENQALKVITASSSKSALEQAKKANPDLILLDTTMPEMDGYAIKEALNGEDEARDIPVIFLSSRSQIDYKMRAFDVGAQDFLVKPVHPEELLARVGVALRWRRREQDLLAEIERLELTIRGGGLEVADEDEALERLKKSISLADTRREPIACLLVKITGLENVHNTTIQRMVIVETSGALQEMANAATDTVLSYREEGEYLMYAVGMTIKRASILAEGLKSSIVVRAFEEPTVQQTCGVAMGISGKEYGQRIKTPAILEGAEEALRGSIAAGGNRVSIKRLKETGDDED